jgi:heat shock protein HtpX
MFNVHHIQRKPGSFLRTFLYLSAMILLMAALGWSLAGIGGLIVAVVFFSFSVFLSQQVPVEMIMRFYRGQPLHYAQHPFLFSVVTELSKKAGLQKVPKIFYLPSGAVNAFAAGRPSDAGIAITGGLLQALNQRELAGVIAHEMSHLKNDDLKVSRIAAFVHRLTRMFAFFGQFMLFINLPLLLMGEETIPWITILLLIFAPTISVLFQLAISRNREFDADEEAVSMTGDPLGLASALQKIEWINRGGLTTFFRPLREIKVPDWLRTHPSTDERVKRLKQMASQGSKLDTDLDELFQFHQKHRPDFLSRFFQSYFGNGRL